MRTGFAILKKERLPYDEESSESDSDSSDCSGGDNGTNRTELEQILKDINSIISYLYELAIIVRNPAPIDKFQKVGKIDNKSEYLTWDIQHVRDKFPLLEQRRPFLLQRLGRANTRRRQVFGYLEKHNSKLKHGVDNVTNQRVPEVMVLDEYREDQQEIMSRNSDGGSFSDRAEIAQMAPSMSAPTLGTITTVSTFIATNSQVDFDDNEIDDGPSETSSAASEGQVDEGGLEIPDPPVGALEGIPFECPYCYDIIKAPSTAKWR